MIKLVKIENESIGSMSPSNLRQAKRFMKAAWVPMVMILASCENESVSIGASADGVFADNTVVGSWTARPSDDCEIVAKFSSEDVFSVLTQDSIVEGFYRTEGFADQAEEMLMSMTIADGSDIGECAAQALAVGAGEIVFSVKFVDLDVMTLKSFAPHESPALTWVKDSFRGINRGDQPNG